MSHGRLFSLKNPTLPLSIDYRAHLHGQATGNLHISKRKRWLEVLCDIRFPFMFPGTDEEVLFVFSPKYC